MSSQVAYSKAMIRPGLYDWGARNYHAGLSHLTPDSVRPLDTVTRVDAHKVTWPAVVSINSASDTTMTHLCPCRHILPSVQVSPEQFKREYGYGCRPAVVPIPMCPPRQPCTQLNMWH